MSDQPTVPDKPKETPPVEIKKVEDAVQSTPNAATPAVAVQSAPNPAAPPEAPTQPPPAQLDEKPGWVTELPPVDNLYNFGMAQSDRDRLIAQQLLFSQFLRDHIKLVIPESKIQSVLDIGCADGQVTRAFSDIYPKAQIVGLDKDAGAIEKAKKNQELAAFVDNPIEFIVGDAEGPLPDGPFDLVYASHTMLYVPNYKKSLQEIFRVLRPGGYIWIKDFDTHLGTAIENNANYARYMVLVHATMLRAGLNVFFALDLFNVLPEIGFEDVQRVEERYPIGNTSMNSRIATSIMLGGIFNIRHLVAKMMNIPIDEVTKMHKQIVTDSTNARGSFSPANIVARKPLK